MTFLALTPMGNTGFYFCGARFFILEINLAQNFVAEA